MLREQVLRVPLTEASQAYIEAKQRVVATALILLFQGSVHQIHREEQYFQKWLRTVTVLTVDKNERTFRYVLSRIEPAGQGSTFINIGGTITIKNKKTRPLAEIQLPGTVDEVTKESAEDDLSFDTKAYRELYKNLIYATLVRQEK